MVRRLDVGALVLVVLACRTRSDVAPPDSTPVQTVQIAEASPVDAATALAPLAADGGWMQVWDEGPDRIHAAVPTGATSKRPVIVAVHGAQDRPDWACAEWFGSVGGFAFVLCPRGVASETQSFADGFVWTSADAIVRTSERALAAARARWGEWMSDGPALYGAWSQASSLAFAVLPAKPELFGAAVLVEIGHTPTDPVAIALAGKRLRGVAVVCSTASCEAWAARAREPMKRAGTRYETWSAGHRGHVFDGEVAKSVFDAVAWVTAGDPQWER